MELSRARVESALDRWLPPADAEPRDLHRAMRYAALAGGKYVRPLLVYATGHAFGVTPERLDGAACAVELIHAYSLVHDDLPAMDNDLLRRGKPSCHVAFGEAPAILTGDALQALAFHILAADPAPGVPPAQRLRMIDTLAHAGGSFGMAGGQAIDLAAVGRSLELEALEDMHTRKTGALIRASVLMGALAAGDLPEETLAALGEYARCIGLTFQIRDDVLDAEGDTTTLGKTSGSDRDNNKPTYATLLGVDAAKHLAEELHREAVEHLEGLGAAADLLRQISAYIIRRIH
ncbi:MAG: (2E,6E)-farnesyl diphosphate synthase [Gammaproteobacteria bacterium]|nr:(2E,6E)-farnesyl diphosphate synthase [Gammaproteobacteria bacterium]